jgi:thioredoxin-related protein
MRLINTLFCFGVISSFVFAGSNKDFLVTENLHAAFKVSEETQKPILLIFSADWCKYCQFLKDNLPELQDVDNFVVCIIDSDKEKTLYRQMNIRNLPTSIILDSNNFNEQNRKVGYIRQDYENWLSSNISE